MYLPLITELTIIFTLGLFGGILSKRFKMPVVAGYLVLGALASIVFQGRIKSNQAVLILADLGIALLLFSNGLEFSLERLSKATHIAMLGALVQVLATSLFGFLIFPKLLNISFPNALILAFGISLSSTSVVLKILNDKNEARTLHGELMIGWLIAQDLLVVPMILFIPIIAKANGNLIPDLIYALLKAILIGYLILLLGKKFIPYIFQKLARLSSKELMLVASFALSLLLGSLTQKYLGSFALGAFLGGVVLSSSYLKFEVKEEIRPFRDLFSVIFFVTIGFLLNPAYLIHNPLKVAGLTLLVLGIKFIVIFFLVSYLGFHTKVAFIVSLSLLEVGEFAFVLARLSFLQGGISDETYQLIVSTTVISLLLTSYFMSNAKRFYKSAKDFFKVRSKLFYNLLFVGFDKNGTSSHNYVKENLKDHIILIGYGRVGKLISKVLDISKVSYVVVDYDFKTLEPLIGTDKVFVYGDPMDEDILEFLETKTAKLLVLAIPDLFSSEHIIRKTKNVNPSIKIIGRAHSHDDVKKLNMLGVKDVIEPEFEASLTISEKILEEILGEGRKTRKVISEIIKESQNE